MPLAPRYSLESSICNYLTACSSLTSSMLSGSTYTCYTGIGNVDVASAPAIIVDGGYVSEVVPFSRNYQFDTRIIVREMAAGTVQLGVMAQAVFNEFVDTNNACKHISNPSYNINVWQVMTDPMESSVDGDTLTNTISLRIIGALVPNS